jgi:Holliday junction resolvase RusA-like endonuclease
MSNLTASNLAIAEDGRNLSLSFDVAGDPPVQQRARNTWRTRKIPVFYDPSSGAKARFNRDLRQALADCGVKVFPFFAEEKTDQMQSEGLHFDAVFYMKRCRKDYKMVKGVEVLKDAHQKYPGKKDTDNMMKFIMDAAHNVLYKDDKCVVKITAVKKFVSEEEKNRGPYTTIYISTL